VNTLTDSTIGRLITVASDHFAARQLKPMLLTAAVEQYAPRGRTQKEAPNKAELVRPRLLGAQKAAQRGDGRAHRALLDFTRMVFESVTDPDQPPDWFDELREALLADGYEVAWNQAEETVPGRNFNPPTTRIKLTYEILPTDAGPVPLAAEISALERELGLRGYSVALNHYRQAINAFLQHDYEAANSQLRAALEDLVVQLAASHTGFVKQPNQGSGGQAIVALKATNNLAARDGGDMLTSLWQMSHTGGSHPGTSNADEARFRMQVTTATARLLLHRFP
jgi:hypothetical protein